MSETATTIRSAEIVEAFKDSVGDGKAKDVVQEAARSAGVGPKQSYDKDEAIELADEISNLDEVSSFVRVSASTLKTRIRADNL